MSFNMDLATPPGHVTVSPRQDHTAISVTMPRGILTLTVQDAQLVLTLVDPEGRPVWAQTLAVPEPPQQQPRRKPGRPRRNPLPPSRTRARSFYEVTGAVDPNVTGQPKQP